MHDNNYANSDESLSAIIGEIQPADEYVANIGASITEHRTNSTVVRSAWHALHALQKAVVLLPYNEARTQLLDQIGGELDGARDALDEADGRDAKDLAKNTTKKNLLPR